jgi:hypothetical protein
MFPNLVEQSFDGKIGADGMVYTVGYDKDAIHIDENTEYTNQMREANVKIQQALQYAVGHIDNFATAKDAWNQKISFPQTGIQLGTGAKLSMKGSLSDDVTLLYKKEISV